MKFIDKKITESYFQIYVILSPKEKKELVNKVKLEILDEEKDELQQQINFYKQISKTSKTETSKELLDNLILEQSTKSIENTKYDQKYLENALCEELLRDIYNHIESINLIQVFDHDFSIIGSLEDLNPITLIYSFCFISKDYELTYPKTKGNAYFFTNKDIDMIQTEMMISNNFYKKEKVDKVTEFSDLLFSYMNGEDMRFNLYMDISEIESKLSIDRSEIIDLDRNKYLVHNTNNEEVIVSIKEIYDKNVLTINNELVNKINYENTKTVTELRNKIKEIFSFIYNVKSNIMSILKSLVKTNYIHIDKYTYKHYLNEDLNPNYSSEEINNMKTSFIVSYILSKYDISIVDYVYYINHEFNLFYKFKKQDEVIFEEYFNKVAPYYALYEFFKSKNLVTERNNNE